MRNVTTLLSWHDVGRRPTGRAAELIQFPISLSRDKFWENAPRTLAGLSDEHVLRVQGYQPFAGCDWIADLALLSPGVTRRLVSEFASRARRPAPVGELDLLTDREREVVALVGEGLSNDEIAERLIVSPATAKTHVSRAMVKLGARDRAQLVVIAYESGLVRPGWYGGASPGRA